MATKDTFIFRTVELKNTISWDKSFNEKQHNFTFSEINWMSYNCAQNNTYWILIEYLYCIDLKCFFFFVGSYWKHVLLIPLLLFLVLKRKWFMSYDTIQHFFVSVSFIAARAAVLKTSFTPSLVCDETPNNRSLQSDSQELDHLLYSLKVSYNHSFLSDVGCFPPKEQEFQDSDASPPSPIYWYFLAEYRVILLITTCWNTSPNQAWRI